MLLSVIIPSWKDPYLQKTINSLIENSELGEELEIIAVLDGYWPEPQLEDHPRLRVLHLGKNRGMRGAINAGVAISQGEYLMRTDEHCLFAPGYDRILLERFKDNWIVYPRRYYLDPEKWEVMDKGFNDYNKLIIDQNHGKFAGLNWKSRENERKEKMIDESMAMQGSCWLMKRSWWDKVIKELQTDGYGPLYQDSHEMVFKTWQAGGRLMVNKNTWYAHKDRSFSRTHNYGTKEAKPGWDYALAKWGPYYEEIRKKWQI